VKKTKIYSQNIEQSALDQFEDAMSQEFVVSGALMPDAHMGYSLPIGSVVATSGVVVPSWVGYDIGCGMCAVNTGIKANTITTHADALYSDILSSVPVGFNHNKKETKWDEKPECTAFASAVFNKNGLRQLGSLGGGNHFIELGRGNSGDLWVVVHSGSRGIGHSIARHYMMVASNSTKAKEGHFQLSVDSVDGRGYITDMKFCEDFALANREEIVKRVLKCISDRLSIEEITVKQFINRNHNHAELKDGLWIHRKGATHADKGMFGVIPANMRDGSFIVVGKGNDGSLCSSSHGAGRVFGRRVAKEALDVDTFARSMDGIVANVSSSTLDESPAAYKDIFTVMSEQEDLVEVVDHVKPIVNVKG